MVMKKIIKLLNILNMIVIIWIKVIFCEISNLYLWFIWFGIFRCFNWLMKFMYGCLYIFGFGNVFGGFFNKKKYMKVIVCKI